MISNTPSQQNNRTCSEGVTPRFKILHPHTLLSDWRHYPRSRNKEVLTHHCLPEELLTAESVSKNCKILSDSQVLPLLTLITRYVYKYRNLPHMTPVHLSTATYGYWSPTCLLSVPLLPDNAANGSKVERI